MPRANNNIVGRKKCPLCPNGHWDIKHFNNQTYEPRYASGSCGCQFRAKAHQEIFDLEDETPVTVEPERTEQPVEQPAQPKVEQPEQTQVPNTGSDENEQNKEGSWGTFI